MNNNDFSSNNADSNESQNSYQTSGYDQNPNYSQNQYYSQEQGSTPPFNANGNYSYQTPNYGGANQNSGLKNHTALPVVSLITGIFSVLCFCIPFLHFALMVAALVCGIIALVKRHSYKGMSIAGIICAAVSLILVVIMYINIFIAGSNMQYYQDNRDALPREYQEYFDDFFDGLDYNYTQEF